MMEKKLKLALTYPNLCFGFLAELLAVSRGDMGLRILGMWDLLLTAVTDCWEWLLTVAETGCWEWLLTAGGTGCWELLLTAGGTGCWDWLYGCSVEGFSTDRRGRAVGSAVHSIEATDGTHRSASVSLEKITMKDNILNKRNFLMRKLCFFYLLFSIDRHGTGTGTSIKD